MRDLLESLSGPFTGGPVGGAVTAILALLFLVAAGYLAFGQDHGRGLPLLRVVGAAILLLLGYALFTAFGFQSPF